MLVFVHVSKTGGSTITHMLQARTGPDTVRSSPGTAPGRVHRSLRTISGAPDDLSRPQEHRRPSRHGIRRPRDDPGSDLPHVHAGPRQGGGLAIPGEGPDRTAARTRLRGMDRAGLDLQPAHEAARGGRRRRTCHPGHRGEEHLRGVDRTLRRVARDDEGSPCGRPEHLLRAGQRHTGRQAREELLETERTRTCSWRARSSTSSSTDAKRALYPKQRRMYGASLDEDIGRFLETQDRHFSRWNRTLSRSSATIYRPSLSRYRRRAGVVATPTSAGRRHGRPQPRARGCARASSRGRRCNCAPSPPRQAPSCGRGPPRARPPPRRGLGDRPTARPAPLRRRPRPRHVRHHECRTARHRLEQHERHALHRDGADDVGGAQMGNGVVDVADPLDAVGHAKRGGQPSSRSRSPPWLSPPTKRSLAEGSATLASAAIATSCPFCSLRRPAQTNRVLRPRGRRAPRRDGSETVDPVRDHAHTVRGPPQHATSLFRLFLRNGDDRVAERARAARSTGTQEAGLRPTTTSSGA